MPETPPASTALPFWRRSIVLTPVFAALAAFVVSLRIFERGEIWLDRTYWLAGLAALGGLFGSAATRASWHILTWRGARSWPRLTSALLFLPFFMIAMTAAYAIYFMLIAGQIEMRDDLPFRAWFWMTAQVTALFLISCPAYLLPWPLPVLTLAAGWLLPPDRREEPGKNTRNS